MAPSHAHAFRHTRFHFIDDFEVMIAEQLVPPMPAASEGLGDLIETLPLSIDQVAEVDAESQVTTIEMFDHRTESRHRVAIIARAFGFDVRVLRVGHEADFE